ncbi:MAG: hypothetical protein ACLPSL_06815 [Smithella sp.]
MGALLEWLLKKENKKTCDFIGVFLVIPYIAYYFSGGFPQGINEDATIFSTGWFRGILLLSLVLMFGLGLILMAAGFLKRRNDE